MSILTTAAPAGISLRIPRTSPRVTTCPRSSVSSVPSRKRWEAGGKTRSSSNDEATTSVSSSIDALDKLLGSMDESDLPPSARPSAREDPFADYTPPATDGASDSGSEEDRARSEKGASGSAGSFEGRRVNNDRTEIDDFLDVGMRFEGLWTLLRAISKGSVFNVDLGQVEVGELVVVGLDKPSLQLWEAQAYELTRVYYQRTTDELGTRRVDVDSLGESPPKLMYEYEEEAIGEDGDWIVYCELFSEDYHSSPVRVRPEEVGLRSVGAEIGEALFIAVPVAFFWAAVSASFVVTSLSK